ncbi:hypothetical protein [Aquimonas voraii]|uniref:DUF2845 domain-containing protein n=1 Tax=Aquimonas voraii TaxID=265719 RepID=A0A1G6UZS7_9GAMM|nr:hypothetical protein [Aquimonas voraii]SDD46802.1 hypothetical protein SAMN04488509_102573 [Aquimonas voraii]
MRRRFALVAVLIAGFAPLLPAQASPSHSEACGQSVITVGAAVTKLRECGEPWRIVTLVNAQGAPIGERWEYERQTGLVMFTVQGGRVVRVERT